MLFNLSQYCWLLDLTAMGYVKYIERWEPSFCWGLFGLVSVSCFWGVINNHWKQHYYTVPELAFRKM